MTGQDRASYNGGCQSLWPRYLSCVLACGYCGFEILRGYGGHSLLSVVFCQVEVFVMGRSLVQMSPTECVCVCLYVCVSVSVIRGNNNPVHRGTPKF